MPENEPTEESIIADAELNPSWSDRHLGKAVLVGGLTALATTGVLAYIKLQSDGQSEEVPPEEMPVPSVDEPSESPFNLSIDFIDGGVQMSPALAVLIAAGIWIALKKR